MNRSRLGWGLRVLATMATLISGPGVFSGERGQTKSSPARTTRPEESGKEGATTAPGASAPIPVGHLRHAGGLQLRIGRQSLSLR